LGRRRSINTVIPSYPQSCPQNVYRTGDASHKRSRGGVTVGLLSVPAWAERSGPSSGAVAVADASRQLLHVLVGLPPLGDLGADLLRGVHHGGVVAAAEGLADRGQRQLGQFATQIHGDLPRERDGLRLTGAAQVVDGE